VAVSKSREIKFARPLTEVIYERFEKGTDGLEDCRCVLANLHYVYVKTHSYTDWIDNPKTCRLLLVAGMVCTEQGYCLSRKHLFIFVSRIEN
jgi:hypothetical protein